MPLPPLLRSLAPWLLGQDAAMRIRMTMALAASAMVFAAVGVVLGLAYSGFGYLDWALYWAAATTLGLVLMLAMIRSRWSLRLSDPAMTQWQIRFAVLSNAAAYVLLGQARGVSPVMLSMALMFGIFGMTPRQFAANIVFSSLAFAAAIAAVAWLNEPGYSPALQTAFATTIALVLLGSLFIASRLQHIRNRMATQKQQLEQALLRISQLATRDELTGLTNRRHMTEILHAEHQRCTRAGQPMMVAMLDLDLFKRINDTEGHAAGDQVLQDFARAVQAVVRSSDVFARWGGEEFVLLLHGSAPAPARELLERVRERVAQLRTPAAQPVTVSIGVALSQPHETLDRLLERADNALYQAKAQGRNQVVLYAAPKAPHD